MESTEAVAALGALAHPTRLEIFRRLVQAGPAGRAPSGLADELDVPAPTLSFHLKELKLAGVVDSERSGRSLLYTPRFDAMRGLVAFLLEDCCGGRCGPAPSLRDEPADDPDHTHHHDDQGAVSCACN